ncbi:MAG: substrate-binding domain-containing protein, partial [Burkholderiales bacterium]
MFYIHFFFLLCYFAFSIQGNAAESTIRIVGSSTVYPFVTVAAEEYSKKYHLRTPVVEATGTGGGLKLFCSNKSKYAPDLANASRRMKASEIALCHQYNKKNIGEIKLGYDGIVFVQNIDNPPLFLSKEQLFLALAKEVPNHGKLIPNPYKYWHDIDETLPKKPIIVYGPPPTSGTRDAFSELIMEVGCHKVSEYQLANNTHYHNCHAIREDGAFIEAGENDNLIIQKLSHNVNAIGMTGYSYFEQNREHVSAAYIDNIYPDYDHILKGIYSVSRPIFIYINWQHLDEKPHLHTFLEELVSDAALGEEGYLAIKGLIPLSANERQA